MIINIWTETLQILDQNFAYELSISKFSISCSTVTTFSEPDTGPGIVLIR